MEKLGVLRVQTPPVVKFLDDEVVITFVSGPVEIELSTGYATYRLSLEKNLRALSEVEAARRKKAVLPMHVCPHIGRPCEKPPAEH